MLIRFLKGRYYDADNGQPQGGGQDDGGKVRASDLRAQLGTQVDEQALMRLLEKQAELLSDNSQLREQRRQLRQEVTDLKAKQPAEGSVMLSADDAALLENYRAIGTPDDLSKALTERDDYAGRLTARERADAIGTAAAAAGYKPSVLASLVGQAALSVKDVGDGKDRKQIAYIADAEGKEHRLTDYAEKNWADFLPALAPKQAGDGVGSPANGKRATGQIELASPGSRF